MERQAEMTSECSIGYLVVLVKPHAMPRHAVVSGEKSTSLSNHHRTKYIPSSLYAHSRSSTQLIYSFRPPLQDVFPLDSDSQCFSRLHQSVNTNGMIGHVVVDIAVHHRR